MSAVNFIVCMLFLRMLYFYAFAKTEAELKEKDTHMLE